MTDDTEELTLGRARLLRRLSRGFDEVALHGERLRRFAVPAFTLAQRLFARLQLGDVDEIDDNTIDALVRATVGKHAGEVPRPALVAHFTLHVIGLSQNCFCVALYLGIRETVREVGQRTPAIH